MKKNIALPILLIIICFTIFKLLPLSATISGNHIGYGAAAYKGSNNVTNSRYYTLHDFYNMQSNNSLTILPKFKTRQQTTPFSCGPSAALMVIKYLSPSSTVTEEELCQYMSTSKMVGTGTKNMIKYFKNNNWTVESSYTHDTPDNPRAFREFVLEHLEANMPILVENIEWGGHWRVIIGYDTMGTSNTENDVLIFADPYDTSDHYQDGYTLGSAHRFFAMWFDAHLFPKAEQKKQWLSVKNTR